MTTTRKLLTESNGYSSEVLQVLNNAAGLEYGIRTTLEPVPAFLYPDNPSNKEVLPVVDSSYSSAAQFLAMLFSLTNVGSTWASFKTLYHAENKNLEKWADFGFNFLKMGLWFAFIGVAAAGLIFVAPYLLVALAGLGVGYGVFNIVKHIVEAVRAQKEKDKEKRNAHLEKIPAQILLTAISSLGLVFGIDAGINLTGQLHTAMSEGQGGQLLPALMTMKAVGAGFTAIQSIFYTLTAVATFGAIASKSTWDMNKETWKALSHPQQTYRKAKEAFVEKCITLRNFVGKNPLKIPLAIIAVAFEIVSLAAQAVSRTIALVATPVLAVGWVARKAFNLVGKGVASLFSSKKEAGKVADYGSLKEVAKVSSTSDIRNQLKDQHEKLNSSVAKQLTRLQQAKQTPKILAKTDLMTQVQKKLSAKLASYDSQSSLEDIESSVKFKNSSVYQSFWRAEGKTEQIVREAKQFDETFRSAAIAG